MLTLRVRALKTWILSRVGQWKYRGWSRSGKLEQVEWQKQDCEEAGPGRSSRYRGQYNGDSVVHNVWSRYGQQDRLTHHWICTTGGPAPFCDLSANGKPAGYRPKLWGYIRMLCNSRVLSVTISRTDIGLLVGPTLDIELSYIYLDLLTLESDCLLLCPN